MGPHSRAGALRLLRRAGRSRARHAEATAKRALTESAKVDISELVFSVLEAAKHTSVVPLGSAFPSPMLFPLQRLSKSLAQTSRTMNPWSTVVDLPPGNEALRQQIALRYLGMGLSQPLDEIVVTNGALEALNLCLMAVTRPGDVVAVESPGFYAALQAIERLDLRAVEIPVDPQTGLDLDALAQALEKQPIRACWFMTNYQNPTGATMPVEKKKALVELLARYEVPLIEDDVYGELHFQADYPLPAIAFDRKGLVMHCSSFSKTLAPGYRIGWAAAGKFAEKVQRAKLMTTLSASIPVQAGIADYLQHGGYDRHLRKLRAALRATRRDESRATPRDAERREVDLSFRWLFRVARITRARRCIDAAQAGDRTGREPRAWADLFRVAQLSELRAAELRAPLECRYRTRRACAWRVDRAGHLSAT